MPVIRSLDKEFFKTWTSEMAYVLGFFAADGSMLKNNRGAHFIEFTVVDRILLEIVQKATRSTHTIAVRERGGNNRTAYRLQVGCKEWFLDLTALGFTQNKSKTLAFPAVPEKYLEDFVRGYFDGDGCVYLGKRARRKQVYVFMTIFTSGSKRYLESLWVVLKKQGIVGGSLVSKNRGFELKLSWRDSVALYRLMYNTDNDSLLFLPRKREKLERAITVLKLRE